MHESEENDQKIIETGIGNVQKLIPMKIFGTVTHFSVSLPRKWMNFTFDQNSIGNAFENDFFEVEGSILLFTPMSWSLESS